MSRQSGFIPLKPGCIHMRCPACGRKKSNMTRHREFDHPTAYMVEMQCDRADGRHSDTDGAPAYFDKRGRELDPWAWQARRERES